LIKRCTLGLNQTARIEKSRFAQPRQTTAGWWPGTILSFNGIGTANAGISAKFTQRCFARPNISASKKGLFPLQKGRFCRLSGILGRQLLKSPAREREIDLFKD